MRSFFFTLLLALGTMTTLFAQSPGSFNYQAVLRDDAGAISQDQAVAVEFIVHASSPAGPEVYAEVHNTMTNAFGLVNLKIGEGSPSSGSLENIDWPNDTYFLEVILDGSSAGTQELTSVPYSLYASESGFAGQADFAVEADFANLAASAADDDDRDPSNELQTLSIDGSQISLSNGGSVTLPAPPATYWVESGDNISAINSGNVGIGTANPDNPFEVQTESAVGPSMKTDSSVGVAGTGLPGFTWQSITASQSGYITEIEAVYGGAASPNAAGILNIYAGEGTSGELLHSQAYGSISGGAAWVSFPLTNPLFITQGDQYTIRFSNFFWLFTQENYSGGRCNFSANADFGFRVFLADEVETSTTLAVGSGRVGIGTNTPREELEVVGDICYTGSMGACSDQRYKTDFAAISNPLEKIQQFSGLYYNWKQRAFPERQFTDQRQIGVIAQELEKVFPEIVMTDDEGYKSVDYGKLTPVLLEAIKQQQTIIREMQAETKSLKDNVLVRLDALENARSLRSTSTATLLTTEK